MLGTLFSRRMKSPEPALGVAVLVGQFPTYSETFITSQLWELRRRGHELRIFSLHRGPEPAPGERLAPEQLLCRTTWVDVPRSRRRRALAALPRLGSSVAAAPALTLPLVAPRRLGRNIRNLSALYALRTLVRDPPKADVLHAHFGTIANSFLFAKPLLGVPLVVSFHGGDYGAAVQARGASLYSQLFATADAITVNSEYARRALGRLGCSSERIYTLPYGLDVDAMPCRRRALRDGETVRLITVARLVEKKGLEYSLRAIASVRRAHPRITYEIVGDGPLRAQLRRLADDLGLGGIVTFHGSRGNEFVRELMARSHLFVLASVTASDGDREGTPVSLLEAQASGMPVVATLHSGIPEVVEDGKTGFLVAERDVGALAERLTNLLERPDLWGEIGAAGRRYVQEHHDLARTTEELVAVYREVIRRHGPPRHASGAAMGGRASRPRDDP
jgi:colanic acid/amylovoran biosynthesis glycosyltransferase